MSVPGPNLGPCSSWIDGDDVAACCDAASNPRSFDDVALDASMLMFEISGRLFPGICTRTVRPCRDKCRCSFDAGYLWSGSGGWRNECGDSCGCGSIPRLRLAGYPVREIEEVKIDGEVIDASEYRLERRRYLTRLSDPGPPVVKRWWPACQDLTLEDDQPGTFSITYSWGVDPPPSGMKAAAELACQLYSACNGGDCSLPAGATRITRQGVEIERELLLNFIGGGATGLPLIDTFLAAYPRGIRRRPVIWSPDVTPFPRSFEG